MKLPIRLLFVLATGAAACAPAAPPADTSLPRNLGLTRYDVALSDDGASLHVNAVLPVGMAPELAVDEGAEPYVRALSIKTASGAQPVPFRDGFFRVPACPQGCALDYMFDLAGITAKGDDPGFALRFENAAITPPSTWLVRPFRDQVGPVEIRVRVPENSAFVTGLYPRVGTPGVYEADLSDLDMAPYSAFGPLDVQTLDVGGGEVVVAFAGPLPSETRARWLAWVGSSAATVSGYYGRFPLRHALVLLLPSPGASLGFARTLGNGGGSIVAPVGVDVPQAELDDDWVMTHEMIHLAFPNLIRKHAWLEEGIATYVEPFARARTGKLAVDDVWRGLAWGLPQGLPEASDQGLDNTPTWGRKYWGGALFCMVADVSIRERSGGKKSLDDALRGILAAGGDVTTRWTIEDALTAGDRATGVPVLLDLYRAWANAPVNVDVDALLARLGVTFEGRTVLYDEAAPLAAMRRAMTAPSP